MNLLQMFKHAVNTQLEPTLLVKFRELILIIQPGKTATLDVPKGSQLTVTGYAGALWITVEGSIYDYKIKNGETAKIPGGGKVVIQAMTTTVPCRLHVVYEKPTQIH